MGRRVDDKEKCSLIRSAIDIFGGLEGLFSGCTGIFCGNTGLFCGNTGLFCGYERGEGLMIERSIYWWDQLYACLVDRKDS